MADAWQYIGSVDLDSSCDSESQYLKDALDGTDDWIHNADETHWFVIDLGETYTIKKVRGRSNTAGDPTDVNIYIDDDNPPTTLVHEGITTWANTIVWVEIDITDSDGRYIKVEIESTEHRSDNIGWGDPITPFEIFDVYGDVAAPPVRVPKPTVAVGNPLMFQVLPTHRRNLPTYRCKPKLHYV